MALRLWRGTRKRGNPGEDGARLPERAMRRARRAGRSQRPVVRARPAQGLLVRGLRRAADARGEDRRRGGPRSPLELCAAAASGAGQDICSLSRSVAAQSHCRRGSVDCVSCGLQVIQWWAMLVSNQRPLPCESGTCSFAMVRRHPISAFLSPIRQYLSRGRSSSFASAVVKLSSDRHGPHARSVFGVVAWKHHPC